MHSLMRKHSESDSAFAPCGVKKDCRFVIFLHRIPVGLMIGSIPHLLVSQLAFYNLEDFEPFFHSNCLEIFYFMKIN